jgi:hypothetical protein
MNATNLNELQPLGQTEAVIFGKRAEQMLSFANASTIDCAEVAQVVATDLKTVKLLLKEVEDKRLSITRPLDQAKAGIMDLFRPATNFLTQAETVLTAQLRSWDSKVKAERAAVEAAQRKLREAEAHKLREQQAAADAVATAAMEAAREAAAVGANGVAAEKIAEAEQATAAAQALGLEAKLVPAVILAPEAKLADIGRRENWQYRVTDIDLVPREYLCLDEKKVGGVVKAMKRDTAIPGIEVYDEGTFARTR